MFDLAAFAAECRVADVSGFLAKMRIFHDFLVGENEKFNLTRLASEADFELKHVADSLTIAREFPEFAERPLLVADIGCGAGFPSVVLAAAFPQLKITAIDSTGKKINFVAEAGRRLGLANLETVCGRSIELNHRPEFQRRFDVVTARAVGELSKIYGESARFPKRPGGRFIFYKTPVAAAAELAGLAGPLPVWHVTAEFELPENAGRRLFITATL